MGDVRARHTAGVEGAHRQLGARLADRLRGDDADRVADLAHLAGGEKDAVTGLADAGLGAALEHRAHRDDGLAAELLLDPFEQRHGDDLAGLGDHRLAGLARGERLVDVLGDDAAEERLVQALGRANRQFDPVGRLAVGLADDHVLRHVDETPRQVTGVGGAQRGVGEALAGAVGRDEVLEHRQAFHEVGLDRALDDLALRIRHQAAHAGELADLLERAACARRSHHEDRVQLVQVRLHRVGNRVGRLRPDVDDRLVALVLGDQAAVVLAVNLVDARLVPGQDLLLVRRDDDVVLGDRDAGDRAVPEPKRLDRVERRSKRMGPEAVREHQDVAVGVRLRERLVGELELVELACVVADQLGELAIDARVEDHAAGRREVQLATEAELDRLLEADALGLDGELDAVGRVEPLRSRIELGRVELREVLGRIGQVVDAEHHVLGRGRKRAARGRREDVVRRQHQDPCLGLSLGGERQVDGHLVAVEVGVESVADERMDLDRLAFDEHGLERLDAEAVERRCAVQEYRMLGDHLFEDVPDLGRHRVDVLLRRLDVLHRLALDEAAHDERLEELERHQLR